MLKLLKEQTKGYEIITVGSSAGGYAACLYGQYLGASRVYAFNAQFELNSLLHTSTEAINPLLFRLKDDPESRKLYDIKPIIKDVPIYYFASAQSPWDATQLAHIAGCSNIVTLKFRTAHHGVPFPKAALSAVLSCDPARLADLSGREFTPWGFSRRFIGSWRTLRGAMGQTLKYIRKRFFNA